MVWTLCHNYKAINPQKCQNFIICSKNQREYMLSESTQYVQCCLYPSIDCMYHRCLYTLYVTGCGGSYTYGRETLYHHLMWVVTGREGWIGSAEEDIVWLSVAHCFQPYVQLIKSSGGLVKYIIRSTVLTLVENALYKWNHFYKTLN